MYRMPFPQLPKAESAPDGATASTGTGCSLPHLHGTWARSISKRRASPAMLPLA